MRGEDYSLSEVRENTDAVVAADQGKKIDTAVIEEKLGIPVIPFSATDVKSYDEFYKTLEKAINTDSRLDVSKLEEQYENTSIENVNRQMEYLENVGIIKRVAYKTRSCSGCSACSSGKNSDGHTCKGCLPPDGFQNMGQMWEVVKTVR